MVLPYLSAGLSRLRASLVVLDPKENSLMQMDIVDKYLGTFACGCGSRAFVPSPLPVDLWDARDYEAHLGQAFAKCYSCGERHAFFASNLDQSTRRVLSLAGAIV